MQLRLLSYAAEDCSGCLISMRSGSHTFETKWTQFSYIYFGMIFVYNLDSITFCGVNMLIHHNLHISDWPSENIVILDYTAFICGFISCYLRRECTYYVHYGYWMHTTTFDLIYTTIVSSWILIFCQRINTRSGWLKTVYIFCCGICYFVNHLGTRRVAMWNSATEGCCCDVTTCALTCYLFTRIL